MCKDAAYEDYDDLSEYAFYMCVLRMIKMQSKLKDRADSDYMYSDAFTFQHDLMNPIKKIPGFIRS